MPTAYWAGGASGAETDTNNAANWVDAANGTNAFGSVPDGNDDVIIQSTANSNVSHNPTQTAAHTFNSIKIEAGGEWTADGSNHLTISGENSSHFAFTNNGTFTHSNGTVVINNGGSMSHAAVKNGDATSTTGFYDLTISGGGTTCEIFGDTTIHRNMEAGGSETVLRGALTVNGTLTVQGTLNTRYSSTDRNLTVNGELSCAGTFTGNSSAVIARNLLVTAGTFTAPDGSGSLTLTGEGGSGSGDGYVFRRTGGTFTHSSGTLTITTPTTTSIRMGGAGSGQRFNNVILDESSTGLILQTNDEGFYCEGDLTITDGDFDLNAQADLITVVGNVSIADGDTLGSISSQQTTNNSFGSLTIASGGTYSATSGTTIIDSENGDFALNNDGTFTHNNGKVNITTANTVIDITGTSGNTHTIDNNVTVASGHTFSTNNLSTSLTVLGNVNVSGTFWRTDNTGTVTLGGLTINSGGLYRATNVTTIIKGALRNLGGTIT